METERALTVPNQPNKSVVATADNGASSLRSGRLIPAVPHFRRYADRTRSDPAQLKRSLYRP